MDEKGLNVGTVQIKQIGLHMPVFQLGLNVLYGFPQEPTIHEQLMKHLFASILYIRNFDCISLLVIVCNFPVFPCN